MLTTEQHLKLLHNLAFTEDRCAYFSRLSASILKATPEALPHLVDSFSNGQLTSKRWLVRELENLFTDLGVVYHCAGWTGVLSNYLLTSTKLQIEKVRLFDIDPLACSIADQINTPFVSASWKFKSVVKDIHSIVYTDNEYEVLGDTGQVLLKDSAAHTIINTSCEHLADFASWYSAIPDGTIVALQSNDYSGLPEHVNCVSNLEEFESSTPMSELLFAGQLPTSLYTRYMLIGIK